MKLRTCEFWDAESNFCALHRPSATQTNDSNTLNALDCISRKDAIDALWKALYEYEDETEKQFQESEELDVADWFLHRIFVQNMSDIDRQTILELPSAQPEPRWIPVTERLPEAGIRYQVTFESGEVGYADFRNKIFFYDGSAKENVWEIERYYKDEGEVIAWMPLPEPYREETEDDND